MLKRKCAALFVEYDGHPRHYDARGQKADERKTRALLEHAPAGSWVLRVVHTHRGWKGTKNSLEVAVDGWRAGQRSSLMKALHQIAQALVGMHKDVLQPELYQRLAHLECRGEPANFHQAEEFLSNVALTSDIEAKKVQMRSYFSSDLGISKCSLNDVADRCPRIWGVSIEGNLKPTVEWLKELGLSREQVAKVVARQPQVLGCSIEDNLKPTVEWLKELGLSREQVAKVVAGFPSVLGCSIEDNLKPTVDWLKELGLSRAQVAKIVARFPQVLSYSIASNLSRKRLLLNRFFSREEVRDMVLHHPPLLGYSYVRLHFRLQELRRHGCLAKLSCVMSLTDVGFAQRFLDRPAASSA